MENIFSLIASLHGKTNRSHLGVLLHNSNNGKHYDYKAEAEIWGSEVRGETLRHAWRDFLTKRAKSNTDWRNNDKKKKKILSPSIIQLQTVADQRPPTEQWAALSHLSLSFYLSLLILSLPFAWLTRLWGEDQVKWAGRGGSRRDSHQ